MWVSNMFQHVNAPPPPRPHRKGGFYGGVRYVTRRRITELIHNIFEHLSHTGYWAPPKGTLYAFRKIDRCKTAAEFSVLVSAGFRSFEARHRYIVLLSCF